MRRLFVLNALLACALFGCADLLDIPQDEPELFEESSQGSGPWWCLDSEAVAPEPTEPAADRVKVQIRACDFVSGCLNDVTGLTAQLCGKRDVRCTNPIQTGITDDDGMLEFEVPTGSSGFDGYLRVEAGTKPCTDFGERSEFLCMLAPACDAEAPGPECDVPTYAPSMVFFNPPLVASPPEPLTLPLLSSDGLPDVVEAAGADLNPAAGNLFITALDCNGVPVSGVNFTIDDISADANLTQLYIDNGAVSDTTLETDSSGVGGFIGVPAGFATVIGYNEDNEKIGEITVAAAPFTMTYSYLGPFSL